MDIEINHADFIDCIDGLQSMESTCNNNMSVQTGYRGGWLVADEQKMKHVKQKNVQSVSVGREGKLRSFRIKDRFFVRL